MTFLPVSDRKDAGANCLEEVPSPGPQGSGPGPGGQRAQSQRLSWRCRDPPQALGLGKGPAFPPQSSLPFPLTQKNMHIHRLSLCDLHLSHLCHSFDCLSQGFLFMFPCRWYLSGGCLGCDDLFRGKKAALNKANTAFTCEQVSWARHSSWSK